MGYLCRRLCKALLLFIISIFVMFACDHRQELYNSDNEVQKRHTAETDFKKLIISAIVSGD